MPVGVACRGHRAARGPGRPATSCTRTIAAPSEERPHRDRERCFVPFVDGQAAQQRSEERLAGRADDDRCAGDAQRRAAARASSARLCARVLPNPIPGSTRIARVGARRRRSRPRRDHGDTHRPRVRRRCTTDPVASCAVCPACASRRNRLRAPRRPAASSVGGAARHVVHDRRTGLERSTRDRGLRGVDADVRRAVDRRARATTGRTRRSSSSASTGSAPGRVDSPPTSSTAAPARASARPWAIAASTRGSVRRRRRSRA